MSDLEYLYESQKTLDLLFEDALRKMGSDYAQAVENLVTTHWLESERIRQIIKDLES